MFNKYLFFSARLFLHLSEHWQVCKNVFLWTWNEVLKNRVSFAPLCVCHSNTSRFPFFNPPRSFYYSTVVCKDHVPSLVNAKAFWVMVAKMMMCAWGENPESGVFCTVHCVVFWMKCNPKMDFTKLCCCIYCLLCSIHLNYMKYAAK